MSLNQDISRPTEAISRPTEAISRPSEVHIQAVRGPWPSEVRGQAVRGPWPGCQRSKSWPSEVQIWPSVCTLVGTPPCTPPPVLPLHAPLRTAISQDTCLNLMGYSNIGLNINMKPGVIHESGVPMEAIWSQMRPSGA